MGLMPEGTELGPIGDKIVFENDQIRVWHVALEPGVHQPWHRHDLPYLIVALADGTVEIRFDDGTVRRGDDKIGLTRWRDAGEVHELHNVGGTRFENLVIEVKQKG
jgi:quercetin dioxygenase-like cupin family protein